MLECPQCGEPEISRQRVGDSIVVIFGCMLSVTLPADLDDIELQRRLDEWKRTGGLERWLQQDLFAPDTNILIIRDKEIVKRAKDRFEKLWRRSHKQLKKR